MDPQPIRLCSGQAVSAYLPAGRQAVTRSGVAGVTRQYKNS
jgi:hypothetical protein